MSARAMLPPPRNAIRAKYSWRGVSVRRAVRGRTAPFRRARSSRPRGSPPRSRRSCPSTACRARAPAALSSSLERAQPREPGALASPARSPPAGCTSARAARRRGSAATARASSGTRAGVHAALAGLAGEVDLQAHVAAAGHGAGAAPARRSAIFSRSTPCTQANCSAIGASCWPAARPMKCQVSWQIAQCGNLRQRLLQVAFAEIARGRSRRPRRTSGAGCALLTARSVTESTLRPAPRRRPACMRSLHLAAIRCRQILRTD